MIKLCIFGGRDLQPSLSLINNNVWKLLVDSERTCKYSEIELVCGMATGADARGRVWAISNGVTVTPFYAKWSKHGKAAGGIRNKEMAQYCDVALGFWDEESRGTANMCAHLQLLRKPCRLVSLSALGIESKGCTSEDVKLVSNTDDALGMYDKPTKG